MKAANPWITYRTRFLIEARQLTTSLTFTDGLGRQHSGRKGDYLVESSDGILSIASRQIFEDIYVPLLAGGMPEPAKILRQEEASPRCDHPQTDVLHRHKPSSTLPLPPQFLRKSPQPYSDRRSSPGLRSL